MPGAWIPPDSLLLSAKINVTHVLKARDRKENSGDKSCLSAGLLSTEMAAF